MKIPSAQLLLPLSRIAQTGFLPYVYLGITSQGSHSGLQQRCGAGVENLSAARSAKAQAVAEKVMQFNPGAHGSDLNPGCPMP